LGIESMKSCPATNHQPKRSSKGRALKGKKDQVFFAEGGGPLNQIQSKPRTKTATLWGRKNPSRKGMKVFTVIFATNLTEIRGRYEQKLVKGS